MIVDCGTPWAFHIPRTDKYFYNQPYENFRNLNDSYQPEPDPDEHCLVNTSSSSLHEDETIESDKSDSNFDIFENLRHLRYKNRKLPIISYININSIRYKFDDLQPILYDKLTNILVVAETKLDESFNNNLFKKMATRWKGETETDMVVV